MEVVEINIENPQDREAVAKQIADVIAQCAAKKQSENSELPDELRTDVDNADSEAIETITESAEFKAFNRELKERVNSLNEFVNQHRKAYNCGIIISAIAVNGQSVSGGGVTYVGRGDAIARAIDRIVDEDVLSEHIAKSVTKRHLRELLEPGTEEDQEDSEDTK